MITKTCTLKLVNETKGALKFSEVDAAGAETVELMGTLYLRKSALAGKPASVTVTVNIPT